jgi:hypothetical protein
LTNAETVSEIDQNGEPYKPSMIDKTSISLAWILRFDRAKIAKQALLKNAVIASPNALMALKKILRKHTHESVMMPGLMHAWDQQKIHHEFQFQKSPVEGTLTEKLKQFLKQEVENRGIPDELTFTLGSFNFYAAIARATFHPITGGHLVLVTHIYIYVRDGFTFTDDEKDGPQYLGHWNKNTFSVIPSHQLIINMMGINHKGFSSEQHYWRGDEGILYPVFNSDFRAWQSKHHRGGDYIIYTDMLSVMLDTPIQITLTS